MPFIIRYQRVRASVPNRSVVSALDPARYIAWHAQKGTYYLSHIGQAAAFQTTEDAGKVIEFFIDANPVLGALHDDFSVRKVPGDNKRPPKVLQKPPPSLWARLLEDDD